MLDADYILRLDAWNLPLYNTEVLLQSPEPRLLDLYCGAGGATKGYQNAGFYTVGVDIKIQKRYCGSLFAKSRAIKWLRDNLDFVRENFQAIHASPPCQLYTMYRNINYGVVGAHFANLIPETREILEQTELPYVIENVPYSPLIKPVTLCGSSFDLDVRRHRWFETNWGLKGLPCNHEAQVRKGKRYPGSSLRNGRYTCEIGVARIPLAKQNDAMGIDWMTRNELKEAVPPAYTRYIGEQLLSHA